MVKTLLLSASYSWFIGLLVIMSVLAVLFVVIALFALKPYRLSDEHTNCLEDAAKILEEREAELNAKLADAEKADKKDIESKLGELATAKKVVKEIAEEAEAALGLGVDLTLTDEEAKVLESGEKVSIEHTFETAESASEDGLKKSFIAKLLQSSDNVKVWYFELKNCILCYEKTKEILRWNNEKFYIGKRNVASLTLRGKQLCLYLAVKPEKYTDKFPVKASSSETYKNVTPCLFRIRNVKDVKQAKKLISLMMADYGVKYVRTNHSIYALPYQDDNALVAHGLAKRENKEEEA